MSRFKGRLTQTGDGLPIPKGSLKGPKIICRDG